MATTKPSVRAPRWVATLACRAVGPPRLPFHLVVGMLGLGLLWVATLPGVPMLPLIFFGWLLTGAAVVWTVKGVVHGVRRRRGTVPPVGRWFLVAPIGGLLVVALLASGLAFDARWALSRPSFEDAVTAATDPATRTPSPTRLGLYRVLGEPIVDDNAVYFHHPSGGGVFDDAGFAYLPEGPASVGTAPSESLRVERIEGDWFRWWSSW